MDLFFEENSQNALYWNAAINLDLIKKGGRKINPFIKR